MTEYMVLIVGDADRWWTTMTAEERKHGYEQYSLFSKSLVERGHKITGGAELHASTEAKHLPPGTTTETIGGYYLVEATDLDQAVAWCELLPDCYSLEVRPVVDIDVSA
ncbi:transcription initiation protein [Yimella sp. RIT 621]|uniref:YciI family protein n=1 Tax=Yimella sp. RIT 621 TaxID=2510323 RepID=UPI00101E20BB|nr:YciI family protein [Yimella sp. RIT 621]RYG78283.1 transcription initiation protein [Yimella sp. RIT 621]